MYSGVVLILLGLGTWIGILSWLVWKQDRYLKRLFPRGNGSFKDRLFEVLARVEELDELKKKSQVDLSSLGLIRYNPYGDTGGDQSFSLALLNRGGDGVVFTSLHSRVGTRVFAKSVLGGKSEKHEFSEEEAQALKVALSK